MKKINILRNYKKILITNLVNYKKEKMSKQIPFKMQPTNYKSKNKIYWYIQHFYILKIYRKKIKKFH